MLIESTTYGPELKVGDLRRSHIFRYCKFKRLGAIEEKNVVEIDSIFLSCSFSRLDLYWTLFNGVLAVGCTFEDCVFRGVSFADCRFVDCIFVRCTYTKNNLDSPCDFTDTVWYGCTQQDSEGLSKNWVPLGG